MSEDAGQPPYVLGHSDRELERLSRQALAFEPFTRQLLKEAGIEKGMRVLDVGSGSGDVTMLIAELVGPHGHVTGVDRAPEALGRAQRRAQVTGIGHVQFLEGDPSEMDFNEPFDAIVGRLVLMYYRTPSAALRKLARHVRRGGLVIFQEFDEENCRSLPKVPLFDRAIGWIKETLSLSGAHMQMGLQLYPAFLDAGLAAPSLRMDALIGGGPECPAYELIAEVIASLLPAMEKFNIATREEVAPDTLAQRLREEVVAARGVVLSPALIGAWARTEA